MELKVVSLNIWGGHLFDAVIQFLQEQDADILALQEVYNGEDSQLAQQFRSFEIIKNTLGYAYSDFAPAFIDNRQEGAIVQGNALMSKYPIIGRDVTFFNEPFSTTYTDKPENYPLCPRNLQHAIIKTASNDIHMFNVHGVWDLDGDNYSERRQRMSRAILNAVKDKPNVIVTGDTNAKPTNQAMRNIEAVLKSVFGDKVTTTFNMRRKDNIGYATAAVDMMFVSNNIQVLNYSVPDVDISDHLPLVAALKI